MGFATVKMKSFVDEFSEALYPTAWRTKWDGVELVKNPLDLWVYQEIIHELAPQTIIETGTWKGGSALYLAGICRALRLNTRIITIDNIDRGLRGKYPSEPIDFVVGDSLTAELPPDLPEPVMVILDSSHMYEHVLAEMQRFGPMVSWRSYMIVEDTNISGHPLQIFNQGDPYRAVQDFLKSHGEFEVDREREKYLATQNPSGYLRKMRAA